MSSTLCLILGCGAAVYDEEDPASKIAAVQVSGGSHAAGAHCTSVDSLNRNRKLALPLSIPCRGCAPTVPLLMLSSMAFTCLVRPSAPAAGSKEYLEALEDKRAIKVTHFHASAISCLARPSLCLTSQHDSWQILCHDRSIGHERQMRRVPGHEYPLVCRSMARARSSAWPSSCAPASHTASSLLPSTWPPTTRCPGHCSLMPQPCPLYDLMFDLALSVDISEGPSLSPELSHYVV